MIALWLSWQGQLGVHREGHESQPVETSAPSPMLRNSLHECPWASPHFSNPGCLEYCRSLLPETMTVDSPNFRAARSADHGGLQTLCTIHAKMFTKYIAKIINPVM